jgi:pimeloyl-ACP methyl ester carboxylesterase
MPSNLLVAIYLSLAIASSPAAAPLQPTVYDPQILRPQLVDIGAGRHLNIVCVGVGSPTVVFEQGGEGSILNWRKVQVPVSAMTRTCFYDRPGFGFSDPPTRPVTAVSVTDDLHALLKKVGIVEPIVLVGHSIGGFYATMYADRFRRDVAGLVLVDPGFAGQFAPRTIEDRKTEEGNIHSGDAQMIACAALAKDAKLSRKDPHGCFSEEPWLWPNRTSDEIAYLEHMFTRPFWYRAEANQSENFFTGQGGKPSEDTLEERKSKRSFGDMPLIVLTAGSVDINPGQTEAAQQAFAEHWKLGHDQLAARSIRGESLVIPHADHFIQLNQPQVVIDAIIKVVAEVRSSGTDCPRPSKAATKLPRGVR